MTGKGPFRVTIHEVAATAQYYTERLKPHRGKKESGRERMRAMITAIHEVKSADHGPTPDHEQQVSSEKHEAAAGAGEDEEGRPMRRGNRHSGGGWLLDSGRAPEAQQPCR